MIVDNENVGRAGQGYPDVLPADHNMAARLAANQDVIQQPTSVAR